MPRLTRSIPAVQLTEPDKPGRFPARIDGQHVYPGVYTTVRDFHREHPGPGKSFIRDYNQNVFEVDSYALSKNSVPDYEETRFSGRRGLQ